MIIYGYKFSLLVYKYFNNLYKVKVIILNGRIKEEINVNIG